METRSIKTPADIIRLADESMKIRHRDSLVVIVVGRDGQSSSAATARMDFRLPEAVDMPASTYLEAVKPCFRMFSRVELIFVVLFSGSYEEAHVGGAKYAERQRQMHQQVYAVADLLAATGVPVAKPVWAGFQQCGHFDSHLTAKLPPADEANLISTDLAGRLRLPSPREDLLTALNQAHAADIDRHAALGALLNFAARLPYADPHVRARGDRALEDMINDRLEPAVVLGVEALLETPFSRDLLMCWLGGGDREFSPRLRLSVEEFITAGTLSITGPGLADSFLGEKAQPPDADVMFVSISFLRVAASYVETDYLPAVFASLAWLEWGWSRTSFAEYYADTATQLDAEYELAKLLKSAIAAGIQAAWVQNGTCEIQNDSLSGE